MSTWGPTQRIEHEAFDGVAVPHSFVAVAVTLNGTCWPEVQAGMTSSRTQLTVCPAATPGNDCDWPSIVIVMSSASEPQFVAEPRTVIAAPGQAAAGLHSAAAWTQGG